MVGLSSKVENIRGEQKMIDFSSIRLVILDIDGVIYYNDLAVPGASMAIQTLREHGFLVKFLTNDAVSSRTSRANELNALGFEVTASDIFTPASLAARSIKLLG